MTSERLLELRGRLDGIDAAIVDQVAERQAVVAEIGELKQNTGAPLRHYEREREVIELGMRRARQQGVSERLAREILQSAVGELPVIAKVGLEDVLLSIDEVIDAGASALSMGPPRGRLPNSSGQTYSGRIYGTAVFPQALELLQQIKNSAIQIIFAGGVQKQSQAELAMANGASGIQLDLMLWKNGGFSALKESS